MGNLNYFSGIVKILETPKYGIFQDKILVTRLLVEISQRRKNRFMILMVWGNLAANVKKFYKLGDFIVVEGYISTRNQKDKSQFINLTGLRVYPFLLK